MEKYIVTSENQDFYDSLPETLLGINHRRR